MSGTQTTFSFHLILWSNFDDDRVCSSCGDRRLKSSYCLITELDTGQSPGDLGGGGVLPWTRIEICTFQSPRQCLTTGLYANYLPHSQQDCWLCTSVCSIDLLCQRCMLKTTLIIYLEIGRVELTYITICGCILRSEQSMLSFLVFCFLQRCCSKCGRYAQWVSETKPWKAGGLFFIFVAERVWILCCGSYSVQEK